MRLICGPCQHESLEQSLEIAETVKRTCDRLSIEFIFKASFDKANRSSISGKRGVGFEQTMKDFLVIKKELGVQTLTDFHSEQQITDMMFDYNGDFREAVDVIQIPAFLCRQTDLLRAACMTGKIVNIKKGQFLAPWDVAGILTKTKDAKEVWITERGTSFGYNNLVVDFTGIQYMLDNYDHSIVMDATHAVQKPGGLGGSSGGNREYASTIAKAAAAIGITNFFIETHPNPSQAPSDGPNMIKLCDLPILIEQLKVISDSVRN